MLEVIPVGGLTEKPVSPPSLVGQGCRLNTKSPICEKLANTCTVSLGRDRRRRPPAVRKHQTGRPWIRFHRFGSGAEISRINQKLVAQD